MADTRAVLIGTGAVLVILGLLFSNLVCGVGILFIILGLVIWQREEDDTATYEAKAPPGFVGPGRRRRRRRIVLALVLAVILPVAAFGGYLLYGQLTRSQFTGIRVSAPDGDCWTGTVGSGPSSSGTSVASCGSASLDLACIGSMWVDLAKATSGNWTLAVSGYRGGMSLGTYSVSGDMGVVRGAFAC